MLNHAGHHPQTKAQRRFLISDHLCASFIINAIWALQF